MNVKFRLLAARVLRSSETVEQSIPPGCVVAGCDGRSGGDPRRHEAVNPERETSASPPGLHMSPCAGRARRTSLAVCQHDNDDRGLGLHDWRRRGHGPASHA